jgi:hypothetical protein
VKCTLNKFKQTLKNLPLIEVNVNVYVVGRSYMQAWSRTNLSPLVSCQHL